MFDTINTISILDEIVSFKNSNTTVTLPQQPNSFSGFSDVRFAQSLVSCVVCFVDH